MTVAKAAHTPGPWKVFRVKDGANKGKIIGIGDAQAGGVTDPFGGLWRSGKELEANAELIAAAPDLLDACISARMQLRVAVIAHSGGLYDHDNVGEHIGVAKLDAAIAKATRA